MLTDAEAQLVADALLLRVDEIERGCPLWFTVADDAAAEAERLTERGYLDRRCDRQLGELLYRASDLATASQKFYATGGGASHGMN